MSLAKYKIVLDNIPWTVSCQQLKSYFVRFGQVHSLWIDFDFGTGLSRGNGYVCYTKHVDLKSLEKEHKIHGEVLKVKNIEML